MVSAPWGVWTRRLEIRSAVEGEEAESHKRTVALVDDASHTYQVALEAGHRGVNVGAPMIVIEHWSLEEPAPALEPDAPAEESPDSETPLNEISVTELDE